MRKNVAILSVAALVLLAGASSGLLAGKTLNDNGAPLHGLFSVA